MSDKNSWLSIGQAAAYLGISRDTLRRWEKKGKIKVGRSPSNRRYYTKNQLDQAMMGKSKQKPRRRLINLKLISWTIISLLITISLLCFAVWLASQGQWSTLLLFDHRFAGNLQEITSVKMIMKKQIDPLFILNQLPQPYCLRHLAGGVKRRRRPCCSGGRQSWGWHRY